MCRNLLLIILTCCLQAIWTVQRFRVEPSNATVQSGARLVVKCEVSDLQGQCQWTKDGFGLGTRPGLPGFPRYTMVEDGGGAGVCDLVIDPVQPADEAVYQCQVGASTTSSALVSRTARITVTSEPGVPYITQAAERDVLEVLEGTHLVLDCVSPGGRPAAEVHWFSDGVKVDTPVSVTENVVREQGGHTFRTHSSFTFVPHKNMKIKCSSSSEQFPETKFSRELQIRLRYGPKVSLEISKDSIEEGDKFSVTCDSVAYPQNVAYKWFFNDIELKGEKEKTLMIEKITRDHHNSNLRCSVQNEIGRTEVATSLNVKFSPTITLHPDHVVAREGENVTLHCVAESNPSPIYLWTKQSGSNMDILEAITQNLTVMASDQTENTYICKVFADGYEIISSLPAKLMLIRRPMIYTELVRKAKLGQNLVLSCLVDSLSNHTVIIWVKEDVPIVPDDVDYRVVKSNKGREFTSDLIISNVRSQDYGHYGCFAVNEVGKDYARIFVQEEKEGNILGAGIGIAIALAVIGVILGSGYYYIKKKCCSRYDQVHDQHEMSTKMSF